jgi:hypothetical protein
VSQFTWGNLVKVSNDADPRLQPGAAVYVVGVHEGDGRSGAYFDRFPDGVVYTIEYEGGASAEIHESDLTAG